MALAWGWSVRSRSLCWIPLVVLASLLWGCANGAYVVAGRDYAGERGRSGILVVPGPRDPESVPAARDVARLLTAELGTHWFNVLDSEVILKASPDLEPHLSRVAAQALAGQLLDREAAESLFRRHGVGQILVLDVFRYEQYWGRVTKITRVGVEARLLQLAEGRVLWQGRYAPEVSDAAGHGFDAATRRVVRELTRILSNGLPQLKDTPMADWPIVEHFTPN